MADDQEPETSEVIETKPATIIQPETEFEASEGTQNSDDYEDDHEDHLEDDEPEPLFDRIFAVESDLEPSLGMQPAVHEHDDHDMDADHHSEDEEDVFFMAHAHDLEEEQCPHGFFTGGGLESCIECLDESLAPAAAATAVDPFEASFAFAPERSQPAMLFKLSDIEAVEEAIADGYGLETTSSEDGGSSSASVDGPASPLS